MQGQGPRLRIGSPGGPSAPAAAAAAAAGSSGGGTSRAGTTARLPPDAPAAADAGGAQQVPPQPSAAGQAGRPQQQHQQQQHQQEEALPGGRLLLIQTVSATLKMQAEWGMAARALLEAVPDLARRPDAHFLVQQAEARLEQHPLFNLPALRQLADACGLRPAEWRLLVAEVRNVHMCFQFASASNLCCALEDLYRKAQALGQSTFEAATRLLGDSERALQQTAAQLQFGGTPGAAAAPVATAGAEHGPQEQLGGSLTEAAQRIEHILEEVGRLAIPEPSIAFAGELEEGEGAAGGGAAGAVARGAARATTTAAQPQAPPPPQQQQQALDRQLERRLLRMMDQMRTQTRERRDNARKLLETSPELREQPDARFLVQEAGTALPPVAPLAAADLRQPAEECARQGPAEQRVREALEELDLARNQIIAYREEQKGLARRARTVLADVKEHALGVQAIVDDMQAELDQIKALAAGV